jgi:FixJ family two-component response regulator
MPQPPRLPAVAVLDDDFPLAVSVCRVLVASGLQAEPFADAAALAEAVAHQRFDAFVLDWWLGHQSALPLIYRLRVRHASALIVLYTGQLAIGNQPTEQEIAQVLRDCRVEFRQKPYSNRALAAELKSALLR